VNAASVGDAIDSLLPQTQCRQCGYAGCRPYAEAIAAGKAGINQCPPGGEDCIHALAALLNREYVALDPAFGVTKPPSVALIDEQWCIGCTLCIQACPVDAIVGAAKLMHTVIAGECTGCELCIPPCPVDCIDMVAITRTRTRAESAAHWRSRYLAREQRLSVRRPKKQHAQETLSAAERRKRETLAQALQRARARLQKNINKNK
jgi:electron transport complex protein RnfB